MPLDLPGLLSAGGVLDRIVEAKAERLDQAKRRVPIEQLQTEAFAVPAQPPERSFLPRCAGKTG